MHTGSPLAPPPGSVLGSPHSRPRDHSRRWPPRGYPRSLNVGPCPPTPRQAASVLAQCVPMADGAEKRALESVEARVGKRHRSREAGSWVRYWPTKGDHVAQVADMVALERELLEAASDVRDEPLVITAAHAVSEAEAFADYYVGLAAFEGLNTSKGRDNVVLGTNLRKAAAQHAKRFAELLAEIRAAKARDVETDGREIFGG